MAVVFLDHSINGKVLNAYNNSIVKFKTDQPSSLYAIVKLTVGSQQYEFKIYPSPTGEYYFNFKQVVSKLINLSNFSDACLYTGVGNLWSDVNAFLNIDVEYKIQLTESTSESLSFNYKVIKAVYQYSEKKQILNRGTKFFLHEPFGDKYYLTVYEGYPFSIGFYGENLMFTVDGIEKSFNTLESAFRLIVSTGDALWNSFNSSFHKILFNGKIMEIEVKDISCGVYLKWINKYGAWDYWLFDEVSNTQKTKGIGSIENDFSNITDTISPEVSMGKESQEEISLTTFLSIENAHRVRSIIESPKVYLYLGQYGQAIDTTNWLEVSIDSKSTKISTHGLKKKLAFTLTKSKTQNLTL